MSKPSVDEQAKTLISEMYNGLDPKFEKVRNLLLQAYKDIDQDNQAPQVILGHLLDAIYHASILPRAPYPQFFQDDLTKLTELVRSNGWGYAKYPTM
ncbi:MAG: hypothetical protein ABF743_06370 [Schleiferilactobacillus perolens]|uniref:hypothetical protein n=1 Tax=Schleiferilactobacillus perolens TaxID=100468 RepID=UPI0039ECF8CC